jgi:hypothetical protein
MFWQYGDASVFAENVPSPTVFDPNAKNASIGLTKENGE